jgi:hypothetical protein
MLYAKSQAVGVRLLRNFREHVGSDPDVRENLLTPFWFSAIKTSLVVLDGELAVPCSLQSAIAGSNAGRRYDSNRPVTGVEDVEGWAHYRYILQTPSGPEGSSGKKLYI